MNLKPNQTISQLLNIRMKVLSEEKLISEYYIIGMISDIVLKNGQINNNGYNLNDFNSKKKIDNYYNKQRQISLPQNKIFLSKESNLTWLININLLMIEIIYINVVFYFIISYSYIFKFLLFHTFIMK